MTIEQFFIKCIELGHSPRLMATIGPQEHKPSECLGFVFSAPSGQVKFHKQCDGTGRFLAWMTNPDTVAAMAQKVGES